MSEDQFFKNKVMILVARPPITADALYQAKGCQSYQLKNAGTNTVDLFDGQRTLIPNEIFAPPSDWRFKRYDEIPVSFTGVGTDRLEIVENQIIDKPGEG